MIELLKKLRYLVGLASEGYRMPRDALTDNERAPMVTRLVDTEATTGGIDSGHLLEKVRSGLIHSISQQLKVKAEDIDVESELSEFGFDSISLTAFGDTLNDVYGLELSPTIFFEYPTVQGFAEYLVQEHAVLLASQLAVRVTTAVGAKRALPLSINAAKASSVSSSGTLLRQCSR